MSNSSCPICNGKGQLPFKRKDGSIVPSAFVDCQCKQDEDESEHYTPFEGRFDFPISESFKAFYNDRFGDGNPDKPKTKTTQAVKPNVEYSPPPRRVQSPIKTEYKGIEL